VTAKALKDLLDDLQARGFRVVHFAPKAPATTLPDYDALAGKALVKNRIVAGATPSIIGIGAGVPQRQRQRAPARARPAIEMTRTPLELLTHWITARLPSLP
jgi:hypothetical protein